MDKFIERGKYVRAFQRQLNEELAEAELRRLRQQAKMEGIASSQRTVWGLTLSVVSLVAALAARALAIF